jgi:hypothetical protein
VPKISSWSSAVDLVAWRHVQAVNVEAALLLAQAFVPGMATRGFGRSPGRSRSRTVPTESPSLPSPRD